MLHDFDIQRFQAELLHWFERNLRDLPWRRDRDPYKIWVSEVMLQQTRVDTVIPYFERFMEQFPSLQDLAAAGEEEVLKLWEGLGYYSRARNLHAGVREVQEKYGGRVPDSPEEIKKIKGVGPYTAGAILSIAYGKPEPAVDGNVMRVLSRLLTIEDDIQKAKTRKLFEQIIRQIIAEYNPSFFNQALMELGALICTPRSPKCRDCPVQSHCRAKAEGVQEQLPVKGKVKPPRPVRLSVAFLEREGRFFIRKRAEQGLLAGLWELPNCEGAAHELMRHLEQQCGLNAVPLSFLFAHQHTFSHLQWKMEVYHFRVESQVRSPSGLWVAWDELEQFTLPVPFQKIMRKMREDFPQLVDQ